MVMKFIPAIAILLALAGCAQVTRTSGGSFTDPAYRGKIYNSIIVDARTDDLAEKQAIENSAANTLTMTGVRTGVAMEIVPPTRQAGETARRRQIMNTGAATVLEIIPGERRIIEDYIPGTQYRDYHRRRHWDHYGRYHDPFYYDPPIILQEPEVRYRATLYSLPHYNAIWTANFTTRGPTGMSFEEVGMNYGRELVERMAQDGIIPPLPR